MGSTQRCGKSCSRTVTSGSGAQRQVAQPREIRWRRRRACPRNCRRSRRAHHAASAAPTATSTTAIRRRSRRRQASSNRPECSTKESRRRSNSGRSGGSLGGHASGSCTSSRLPHCNFCDSGSSSFDQQGLGCCLVSRRLSLPRCHAFGRHGCRRQAHTRSRMLANHPQERQRHVAHDLLQSVTRVDDLALAHGSGRHLSQE